MANPLSSRVPAPEAGIPLAAWLAQRFRYHDAAVWRDEIAAGRVERNGARATADVVLAAGDTIAYRPPPAPPGPRPAVPIVLDDPDFLVVDKPPHLVAHNEGAFAQNTFLHRLAAEHNEGAPLHLVHRLDRETSGLLLLARSPEATALLQPQFAAGAVAKRYLAVVHGAVAGTTFRIEAPIGPAANSAVAARRAALPPGTSKARPACTDVEVVERFAAHTLLSLEPRTGRTHQLRVHLEHLGHPLVGDKLYGRSDAEYLAYTTHLKAGGDPAWGHRLGAGRQLLHAAELAFAHPRTGGWVALASSPPADFAAFVAACRSGAAQRGSGT